MFLNSPWDSKKSDEPTESVKPTSASGRPASTPSVGDPPLLTEKLVAQLAAMPPGRYDARLAYALAVVSAWAYADAQTLSNKLRFYGFPTNTVQGFEVTNHALFVVSTGYVVRSAGIVVIAFRGTDPVNIANWLTDADVPLKPLPHSWNGQGSVHQGFLANFEAIWADIEEAVHALEGTPEGVQAIYLTGHSLGGAMAVLAASKLQSVASLRTKVRGVYTFGQPAVGDGPFARWASSQFGELLFRHVYGRDVVPRLPPTSTGPFHHFGEEYRSQGAFGPGRAPQDGWKASPARAPYWLLGPAAIGVVLDIGLRRTVLRGWFRWLDSLDDHSPDGYVTTSRNAAHAVGGAATVRDALAADSERPPKQPGALVRLREWRAKV